MQSLSSPKLVLIGLSSRVSNAYVLTSGCNETGGKKSVRITRPGVYLKAALVQCTRAYVKHDKSPCLGQKSSAGT